MPVIFCRPLISGDCSIKCQNIKNRASGQRAPILDVLAFHAFRSLRGLADEKVPEGMHAEAGSTPCASFILEYRSPITVLKGKLRKYRKGHAVIHGGLLSWRKNSKNTVIGNGVIDEGLLS